VGNDDSHCRVAFHDRKSDQGRGDEHVVVEPIGQDRPFWACWTTANTAQCGLEAVETGGKPDRPPAHSCSTIIMPLPRRRIPLQIAALHSGSLSVKIASARSLLGRLRPDCMPPRKVCNRHIFLFATDPGEGRFIHRLRPLGLVGGHWSKCPNPVVPDERFESRLGRRADARQGTNHWVPTQA
jgi:hypothetical protein